MFYGRALPCRREDEGFSPSTTVVGVAKNRFWYHNPACRSTRVAPIRLPICMSADTAKCGALIIAGPAVDVGGLEDRHGATAVASWSNAASLRRLITLAN